MVYWIDYVSCTVHRCDFVAHSKPKGFSKSGSASFAWRVPVILQCIFLVPMLVIISIIPETPRWLASHGRQDEALEVLQRLNRKKVPEASILELHSNICKTVAFEASIGAGKWKDLLKNDEIRSRRRLLIASSVQGFQQLGGINAIIYYANTLFSRSLGFDDDLSALMSGFLNTWFFAASFIPWFLIDRVGRRPLFLSMISLMAAVMIVQTGLVWNVQNNTSIARGCGIGAAAMLFVFQGAFTIGFQATVWVYPSEILPLKLRQRGSGISTASNWIMNFIIVYITPPAIQNIRYKTYIIFAVLNSVFVPIVYFFYPETKGLALEEVDLLFAKNAETVDKINLSQDRELRQDVAQLEDKIEQESYMTREIF
nr:sugar transporter stl1 [Quercus suber]